MTERFDGIERCARRLRRVLLPLGVMLAMLVAAVPAAQALEEHHYGGGVIAAGGRVQAPGAGWNAMTGNIAGYEGSGSVSVCEAVYHASSVTTQRTCGINAAGNAINQMAWWGEQMTAFIENNSGSAHTIHGWWYSVYDRLGGPYGRPGGVLEAVTRIESPNRQYSFRMQSDGNAVLYNNSTTAACWNTQTNGRPDAYAALQADGNFVVYAWEGGPAIYASNTSGNGGAYIQMQNDGNLVIYSSGGAPLWATSWITGRLGC